MGIITLEHRFLGDAPGAATFSEPEFTWTLPQNMGMNVLILKSVTTTFTAPDHGYFAGKLIMPRFTEWGVTSNDSSTTSHKSAIDLRWDGTSQTVAFDAHLLVGAVEDVMNTFTEIRVESLVNDEVTNKFYTTPSATTLVPAPVSGVKPLIITLVFEYNHETFQT